MIFFDMTKSFFFFLIVLQNYQLYNDAKYYADEWI